MISAIFYGGTGTTMPTQSYSNQLSSVMRELGEIKGRQEVALSLLSGLDRRLDDHAVRIGKLERARAWLLGVAAVVGWLSQYLPHPFR